MVWWIDSNRYCFCVSKFFYHKTSMDVVDDRIFQSTNIMYNLDSSSYDKHEIRTLTKSGVNIFNIDRTVHDEEFVQNIKEVIDESEDVCEIFPDKYRRPVGLAITMSVTNPIDTDESIDILILKDVKTIRELSDFKKRQNNSFVPVLVWIKTWLIEDLKSIIQFSDGVLLEVINISAEDINLEIVQFCRQAYKSIFFVIDDTNIVNDYRLLPVDDLHNLSFAIKLFEYQIDGVCIFGSYNEQNKESEFVRSMVRALNVIEKTNNNTDVYKLSFKIKTPVLPWISTSLAASLAAKHSGASAIIVLTTSGTSARWIANVTPPCYILAVTTRQEIARRLHLYRKVIPLFYNQISADDWAQECWKRAVFGATVALQIGLCTHGANVVVLAPSDPDVRYCNSLQILSIPLKCDDD